MGQIEVVRLADLTEAERHAILSPTARPARVRQAPGARPAREVTHSRCHTCREMFTTEIGPQRHANATGHRRIDLILDPAEIEP